MLECAFVIHILVLLLFLSLLIFLSYNAQGTSITEATREQI